MSTLHYREMTGFQIVIAVLAGVSLAAASGLRVFLPLLAASLGARAGFLHPSAGFAWITSPTASTLLAAASVIEVAAFLSPWVVHLLDVIATPVAIVAGVVVAAMAFGDIDPEIKWVAATIVGIGGAGALHLTAMGTRTALSGATIGATNRAFGLIESVVAAALSVLAVIVPVLALVALVVAVIWMSRIRRRRKVIVGGA